MEVMQCLLYGYEKQPNFLYVVTHTYIFAIYLS